MASREERSRATVAVCLVGGPLACASAGLTLWASHAAPPLDPTRVHTTWLVLSVLFAIAQSHAVNLQVKREARSVSLTDAPLVLGLLLVSPATFVMSRVAGGFIAQVVARRQHKEPLKLAFNTVTSAAEAATALAVYVWAAGGADVVSTRSWGAAILGAIAANIISGLGVAALIAFIERSPLSLRGTSDIARSAAAHAAPTACVGLIAGIALQVNAWAAAPLLAVCVALLAAYRAYARLSERHHSLERLYRFSQVIAAQTDTETILTDLLEDVCELLLADGAELTFLDADGRPATEVSWQRGKTLERRTPMHLVQADARWIREQVCDDGKPLLISRENKEAAARAWLTRTGFREAMLVPLHRENGVAAVLTVVDRMGAARGFDLEDLRLLGTVANHASTALRNGELMDRLRHDSLHDALTGIANRTYLQMEVDRLLAELEDGGAPFAVAMLDLDSFKEVNDTLGHGHGDALLQEVARRLTTAVIGRGIVTRFGGDEFAVLLPNCRSEEVIARRCQTLLDFLGEPVELEGTAIDVGASIGVARAPKHAMTCDELIKKADVAMYVAKQTGREFVVYDESQDTSSPNRLAMIAALRQAINDGVLDIQVQPQMRLDAEEIVCVEALARWTDPELGVVPPDEFISLAERSGLIKPLTDLVLEKAIAACASWQSKAPGVAVAVNLSARSLHDQRLDEHIERALRRHSLPASLLTLEITESSVMADPASMLGLLHRLRQQGVRLSIDDFGTGYSSLSYLRRLPVQEVKVDRSFVQRMDEEADDAAIVRSIIELARTLDLSVVAEGVENRRIWKLLADMGCALVQGYYLARPMPVEEFLGWYQKQRRGAARRRRLMAVANS